MIFIDHGLGVVLYIAGGTLSLLLGSILYLWYQLSQKSANAHALSLTKKIEPVASIPYPTQTKRIAVLSTPSSFHEQTLAALTHTLAMHGHFRYLIDEYIISEESQYERICANLSYDGFITIGQTATLKLKEESLKHKRHTPIIFSGIRETVWEESEILSPTSHMTGITGSLGIDRRIPLFKSFIPHAKHVLYFAPSFFSAKEFARITELFAPILVTFRTVAADTPEPTANSPLLTKEDTLFDVILIDKVTLSAEAYRTVVAFCHDAHIPLFASEISEIKLGAALAVGIKNPATGILLGRKLIESLERGTPPYRIPVTHLGSESVYAIACNMAIIQTFQLPIKSILNAVVKNYGRAIYVKMSPPAISHHTEARP